MEKEEIIDLFKKNVYGKKADLSGTNKRHDGREGQWLESKFGIKANCNPTADLSGYELKNQTSSKTTFGDWSPNEIIYKNSAYKNLFKGKKYYEKQDSFCYIFGSKKEGKSIYSWSGSSCPKLNLFNICGQKIIIEKEKNDIVVIYNYNEDRRIEKKSFIPVELQQKNLEIARWYGKERHDNKKSSCLMKKVNDKFNQNGWFTCKKNKNGYYEKICFGRPLDFYEWINLVKKETIFFDSGMHQGNKRPYSEWRANNSFWEKLLYEEYTIKNESIIKKIFK